MMLNATPPADSLNGEFRDLIELFFQELRAFGVFANFERPDRARFDDYFEKHLALVNFIVESVDLAAAELGVEVTLGTQLRPILYNTRFWPENAPIAGYSTDASSLTYKYLLATYMGNWNYEYSRGPVYGRFLKAALWMWNQRGLQSAIDYLFDLQKYGLSTFEEGTTDIIELLIHSQTLGNNIEEIIAAYFGGVLPKSQADWIVRDLIPPEKVREEIDPSIAQPVLEHIIFDTIQEIERVRSLTDPVEWMLNQASITLRCGQVRDLCFRFQVKQTTMLKTILDQFSEIRADGGGYRLYRAGTNAWHSPLSIHAGTLALIFRSKFGSAGEARLYQDRLAYPNVLRKYMMQVNESSRVELPREWKIVPPRILWPLVMAIGEDYPPLYARETLFALEQIEKVPDVKHFFEQKKITSKKERAQLLDEAYFRKAAAKSTVAESPGDKFSQEEYDQFVDALRVAYYSLVQEEINASIFESDTTKRGKILETLHSLYPWAPTVYRELAIFYDEQREDLQRAWDHILTATVLDPEDTSVWRAVSVILHKFGRESDADIAWAMFKYLEERKSK